MNVDLGILIACAGGWLFTSIIRAITSKKDEDAKTLCDEFICLALVISIATLVSYLR